jgi:hypothetical protein
MRDEVLPYVLDYATWLGSDTLSAITRTSSGLTVSSMSNTTTTATQSLSGNGYVDIKITTTAGRVKIDRLAVIETGEERFARDYEG